MGLGLKEHGAGFYSLTGITCGGVPEGTEQEWRDMIAAMRAGKPYRDARRLGVSVEREGRWFEVRSPRNAYGRGDFEMIGFNETKEFCQMVESKLNERCCLDGGGI